MARNIPPLNSLRAFETVARHGSFTKAAEELHVSQSAVSRQVSLLEDYLGIKLFQRELRGLSLTPDGLAYHQRISPAFAQIAAATDTLYQKTRSSPIRLRVYTTFAAKWLMRRLPQFQAKHPDVPVQLSTNVAPIDFAKEDVDAAIQFGTGDWPGAHAEHLFDDEITPVCSPALIRATGKPLQEPGDLVHYRMLQSYYRKTDWPDWLAAAGRPDLIDHRDTMMFNSSILTYQAAIDGLGVAIGQVRLLDQELEQGTLVRPFAQLVGRPFAYYLVIPQRDTLSRNVATFRDWLVEEIRVQRIAV
jgi:LysR family glycine cleavage system transcriptional activator